MSVMEWRPDMHGDALWAVESMSSGAAGPLRQEEEFLGCIYNRDGLSGGGREHGWRVLAGERMEVVGDVLRTVAEPEARLGARQMLESFVSHPKGPLPSAEMLLHRL